MPPPPGPPDARSKLRRALGTGGLALCVLVALGVAALFLTLMGATKTGGAPEKHAPTQHLANQAGGPKPWAQAIGAIVSRRAASGAVNRRPTSRRSDTAHSPVTASSSGCSTTSLADRPETVIQLSARVTYVRATSDASAAYRNAHLAASLVAWCASVVPSDRVVATDQWPARIDRGVIGVPPFSAPPGCQVRLARCRVRIQRCLRFHEVERTQRRSPLAGRGTARTLCGGRVERRSGGPSGDARVRAPQG
jgi:hypothetical protein